MQCQAGQKGSAMGNAKLTSARAGGTGPGVLVKNAPSSLGLVHSFWPCSLSQVYFDLRSCGLINLFKISFVEHVQWVARRSKNEGERRPSGPMMT